MRNPYGKAISAALLVVVMAVGRVLAGSPDPTNAPGSTMHTLEEIYQKLEAGTFMFVITNTVTVTNTATAFTNAPAPKTGQTNSYTPGDDGSYQKGVAWPIPRFTVQANTNCVTDHLTGLVWARNANLGGTMNWANAISYCEDLDYGGQTDWRLPNVKELQSLIDFGQYNSALHSGHPFTGIQLVNYYWSSSSYAANTANAWGAILNDGAVRHDPKTLLSCVWPVRGGQ